MHQQTLSAPFELSGVGIHSGENCSIRVRPAPPNHGRVFVAAGRHIPARADYVLTAQRCTTVGDEAARVSTVEHLLAALMAAEVDNALIEVTGPEVPILDGSALPFCQAILAAGLACQPAPPRVLRLRKELEYTLSGGSIRLKPCARFEASVTVEFQDWREGNREAKLGQKGGLFSSFCRDAAPARTFAFASEIEALRARGLARGGSLTNALVISPPDSFSSPLRVPGEWAAHKLLDLLGDLALLDARPRFQVAAVRPGHAINTGAALALLESSRGESGVTGALMTRDSLDIEELRELLPHRYPMLMVDRILELTPGERVVGLKNVTINEPYFNGHFPGEAVMPGVLILEAMAQVAGVIMLSLPEHQGKLAYLGGMDKVRFRKKVVPGDTLIIEATLAAVKGTVGKAIMSARVDGDLVARCEMLFALQERGSGRDSDGLGRRTWDDGRG